MPFWHRLADFVRHFLTKWRMFCPFKSLYAANLAAIAKRLSGTPFEAYEDESVIKLPNRK